MNPVLSYWNSGGCLGNPRKLKFIFSFVYFSSSAISDAGPDVFTWNVPSSACSRNGCPEKPTFLGCLADVGTCPAWIRRDSTGRITKLIVCEKENTEITRLLHILMELEHRQGKRLLLFISSVPSALLCFTNVSCVVLLLDLWNTCLAPRLLCHILYLCGGFVQ